MIQKNLPEFQKIETFWSTNLVILVHFGTQAQKNLLLENKINTKEQMESNGEWNHGTKCSTTQKRNNKTTAVQEHKSATSGVKLKHKNLKNKTCSKFCKKILTNACYNNQLTAKSSN